MHVRVVDVFLEDVSDWTVLTSDVHLIHWGERPYSLCSKLVHSYKGAHLGVRIVHNCYQNDAI